MGPLWRWGAVGPVARATQALSGPSPVDVESLTEHTHHLTVRYMWKSDHFDSLLLSTARWPFI